MEAHRQHDCQTASLELRPFRESAAQHVEALPHEGEEVRPQASFSGDEHLHRQTEPPSHKQEADFKEAEQPSEDVEGEDARVDHSGEEMMAKMTRWTQIPKLKLKSRSMAER